MNHRPKADPTPAEIAAICLEIQSGWSDRERRTRESHPGRVIKLGKSGRPLVIYWTPPVSKAG